MNGTIIKGIGGFYTVLTADSSQYVCKARGRLRNMHISPVVGDHVVFHLENTGHGFIDEIIERKNQLIRPAVSNLDKLLIVISASVPKPDFLLVDKLLATCELYNITPVIVINKCDDDTAQESIASIKNDYANTGYHILCVSAQKRKGLDALEEEMHNCSSCFAGQSAVGKSSLLNAIMPELSLEIGGLSRKTERGRHTTRHAELWQLHNGGTILDTPGFSLIEFLNIEPQQLTGLYPEMRDASRYCRFTSCAHIDEPDCAVKNKLTDGSFSKARYDRYVIIYKELMGIYKHRYD